MGIKRRKPPKRGYQDRLNAALGSLDLPAVGIGRVSVFHDANCPMPAADPVAACLISRSTPAMVMWLLSARMVRSAG